MLVRFLYIHAQHNCNTTGEDIYQIDQFITVAEKNIVNETNCLWKGVASMHGHLVLARVHNKELFFIMYSWY